MMSRSCAEWWVFLLQLSGMWVFLSVCMLNNSFLMMLVCVLQLLDNVENKMKGTCVEGTIPKLFRGKMVVRYLSLHRSLVLFGNAVIVDSQIRFWALFLLYRDEVFSSCEKETDSRHWEGFFMLLKCHQSIAWKNIKICLSRLPV